MADACARRAPGWEGLGVRLGRALAPVLRRGDDADRSGLLVLQHLAIAGRVAGGAWLRRRLTWLRAVPSAGGHYSSLVRGVLVGVLEAAGPPDCDAPGRATDDVTRAADAWWWELQWNARRSRASADAE